LSSRRREHPSPTTFGFTFLWTRHYVSLDNSIYE
jgi:hypothetical protein